MSLKTRLAAALITIAALLSGPAAVAVASSQPALADTWTSQHTAPADTWT
jgi:hypothetical protein